MAYFLVKYLLALVCFMAQTIAIGALLWIPAVLLLPLSTYLFMLWLNLDQDRALGQGEVYIENNLLHWRRVASSLVMVVTAATVVTSFLLGLAVVRFGLPALINKGLLRNVDWGLGIGEAPQLVSAIFIGTYCCTGNAITLWKFRPWERISRQLQVNADQVLARVNCQLDRVRELKELGSRIGKATRAMGVGFPTDYVGPVLDFAQRYKVQLLQRAAELARLTSSQTMLAKSDIAELNRAAAVLDATKQLYGEVVPEVNRSGSPSLIYELDRIHAAISGEALRSLLTDRRWQEFHGYLSEIAIDMRRFQETASQVRNGAAYDDAKEPPRSEDEDSISAAYRSLGLTADASPAEVHAQYRRLVAEYHVDRLESLDIKQGIKDLATAKLQEINVAHDLLKSKGKSIRRSIDGQ